MHPSTERFIAQYEDQAVKEGWYRVQIGHAERLFLDRVWGPAMQYDFAGLQPEYPFQDFKGGHRFCDFVYTKAGMRLVIEIDGFTTHARDISPGDFSDHLTRQNDLVLQGWMILRFSAFQVEKRDMLCQKQLKQALGHWWMLTHQGALSGDSVWDLRRQQIVNMALRQGGVIKAADLVRHFGIATSTAHDWIGRFVEDRTFEEIRPRRRIVGYRLSGFEQMEKSGGRK